MSCYQTNQLLIPVSMLLLMTVIVLLIIVVDQRNKLKRKAP